MPMRVHQQPTCIRALCWSLALHARLLTHMMLYKNLALRSMASLRQVFAVQMVG